MTAADHDPRRTPEVDADLVTLRERIDARFEGWTTASLEWSAGDSAGRLFVAGGAQGGGTWTELDGAERELLARIAAAQLAGPSGPVTSLEATMTWNEPGVTLEIYREQPGAGLGLLAERLEGRGHQSPALAHLESLGMYDGARIDASIVEAARGLDHVAAERLLGREGEQARQDAEAGLAREAVAPFTQPASLLQLGPMLELVRAWRAEAVQGEPGSAALGMPVLVAAGMDPVAAQVRDLIPELYEALARDLVRVRFADR